MARRLSCDPGDVRYCPTKVGDCSACELAREVYGPETERDEEDDDSWQLQPVSSQ